MNNEYICILVVKEIPGPTKEKKKPLPNTNEMSVDNCGLNFGAHFPMYVIFSETVGAVTTIRQIRLNYLFPCHSHKIRNVMSMNPHKVEIFFDSFFLSSFGISSEVWNLNSLTYHHWIKLIEKMSILYSDYTVCHQMKVRLNQSQMKN